MHMSLSAQSNRKSELVTTGEVDARDQNRRKIAPDEGHVCLTALLSNLIRIANFLQPCDLWAMELPHVTQSSERATSTTRRRV
jgi:hypothetical protein